MGLCQGSCKGQKGLSCAGGSCEGDKFYVGIKNCIHCKDLLLVAWGDAVGGLLVYHHYVAGVVVVAGQDGIAAGMMKVVQLVARRGLVAELFEGHPLLLLHELLQYLRFDALYMDYPFFVLGDALLLDVVCEVVLHKHSHGFGLHPQINVFGNKCHCAVAVVVLVPDGGSEDAVVLGVVLEGVMQVFWKFLVGGYGERSTFFTQRVAVAVEEPWV